MRRKSIPFIPGPILAGSLVDAACTLWEHNSCEGRGACLLYDHRKFRLTIHGLVTVVKLGSCLLYLTAFCLCRTPVQESRRKPPPDGAADDVDDDAT
ncbi:PREDICTED: solute carrier organic anion transporter family member 1B1-like [Priapulus caudatus]|uniref:Solute carrier organic anion transporter family member 1B1-like n=1 Tax=Priapulus caudatus TaxID=37621 RepID=A0ABM1E538_PRICU|nr:PREDICTED: solute carrier organic anion transporter family member 1B1-like [Priapulus caudatus]